MAISSSQARALRLTLFLLGVGFFIFKLIPSWFGGAQQAWDGLNDVFNETLGVERIFAINLPERPDKRDNIALASSVSGFRVNWIDGIAPEQISPKIYPLNWNYKHSSKEFAARQAHLNAIQRIVDQRISSAIIMEDDTDWDVSLKKQLKNFAIATRALQGAQNQKSQANTGSPYGDDWDVLWLGHCRMECRLDLPFYLTPEDPTLPNPHHSLKDKEDPPGFDIPEGSRVTCHAAHCVCSGLYAVSYHGAQKILSALSVNPMDLAEEIVTGEQFDIALGSLCRNSFLRCFSSWPSLTGTYTSAGPGSKWSDIHGEESPADNPVEYGSRGLMYSTLLNVNRILKGERTVHATWDDVDVPEVREQDIQFQDGSIIFPQIGRGRKSKTGGVNRNIEARSSSWTK